MPAHLVGCAVLLPAQFSVSVEFPAYGDHAFGHVGIDGYWHEDPSLAVSQNATNNGCHE
jgi:hypothetical protein